MARRGTKSIELTIDERIKNALISKIDQPYQLPENWVWCRVGSICEFERGITFPSSAKESEPSEDNIPCLRTANIQDELEVDDLIYVNKSYMKGNNAKLTRVNDIIMSSANSRELVGKTSYVSYLPCPMTFGGFVLTIRAKAIVSKYLFYYLRFEFLMGKFMGESTQTTNIANINTTKLSEYSFPLPPIAEQKRIVSRIESLFSKLNEAEEKITTVVGDYNGKNTAIGIIEQMRKSILARAFRGELGTSDMSDQNAKELLKSIL